MAVAWEGAESVHQNNSTTPDPNSISITVDTDANLMGVAVSGYSGGASTLVDQLNFDDGGTQDFVTRGTVTFSGSDAQLQVFTMDSSSSDWPGTGSKTLYYSPTGAYTEGFQIFVFYCSGVDTTDPIRDSETVNAGSFSSPQTSSLTGVVAGDLGIAVAWGYSGTPNVDPATYGQTAALESADFNNAALSVGYESGESALRVTSTASESGVFFFALKESTGGGGLSIPIAAYHYNHNLK